MKQPYICPKLPIELKIDSEMINLLAEAAMKYGEYYGYFSALEGKENLLNLFSKVDSYKSTQIEGTNISQSEMFSLNNYEVKNDDVNEILNYNKALEYGKSLIETKITLDDINNMHSILLNSVRGGNKNPGKLRTIQNWIGPSGKSIEHATFIPPAPTDVKGLMENFADNFNKPFDNIFELVQVAISHAHFETIHPYNDGNGRTGRLLIPLNMAMLSGHKPVLYMSEVLEMYKPAYYRALSDYRFAPEKFVKFFLLCVIDQCSAFTYRIEKISKVFEQDKLTIKENFSTDTATKIYNMFKRDVTVKVASIVSELGITEKTARTIIKELINLDIISKKSLGSEYIYTKVYNIFVLGH